MKARFAIALLTVAMLCACALAQEDSAEDWFDMGRNEEAISAFDAGLKTDPQNASAWHHRGMALAGIANPPDRSLAGSLGDNGGRSLKSWDWLRCISSRPGL